MMRVLLFPIQFIRYEDSNEALRQSVSPQDCHDETEVTVKEVVDKRILREPLSNIIRSPAILERHGIHALTIPVHRV